MNGPRLSMEGKMRAAVSRLFTTEGDGLPTIIRFFGIEIRMVFEEHGPPHFHVYLGQSSAAVAIEDLSILSGRPSGRAHGMVVEAVLMHRAEPRENRERARRHEPLSWIEPLE